MSDREKIIAAFAEMQLFLGEMAKHSADIAHARRVLYEAYISEGFSAAEALELCKSVTL